MDNSMLWRMILEEFLDFLRSISDDDDDDDDDGDDDAQLIIDHHFKGSLYLSL